MVPTPVPGGVHRRASERATGRSRPGVPPSRRRLLRGRAPHWPNPRCDCRGRRLSLRLCRLLRRRRPPPPPPPPVRCPAWQRRNATADTRRIADWEPVPADGSSSRRANPEATGTSPRLRTSVAPRPRRPNRTSPPRPWCLRPPSRAAPGTRSSDSNGDEAQLRQRQALQPQTDDPGRPTPDPGHSAAAPVSGLQSLTRRVHGAAERTTATRSGPEAQERSDPGTVPKQSSEATPKPARGATTQQPAGRPRGQPVSELLARLQVSSTGGEPSPTARGLS